MYCKCLYSDQGTNFKGAEAEFRRLMRRCDIAGDSRNYTDELSNLDRDRISHCMLRKCVDVCWHFSAPKNPYAGGSWKRGIKSVKCILKAVYGH